MNNSKLLYVSKYTNLIGGGEGAPLMTPAADTTSHLDVHVSADGTAADNIAAANGQPAAGPSAMEKAAALASSTADGIGKAATALDAGLHDMHAMADSVDKNTQATAFIFLWVIFSLVMLVLLGMRSNDSKNKGGAFTFFAFGLLFWGLAAYFGVGNDQVGESSGYAQACLTISSFFFYFCLYASSDEDGSKKISLWGTIFVVLMSHLFGAFWVSICYSEEKAGSMGHMNIKGSIGKTIGFNIPDAATAAATGV
jgi:hypothetical protein